MLVTRDHLRFATFVVVLAVATGAHGQTDYFWNNTGVAATSGGSGTWDTFTANWDSSTDPTIVNNYIWANSGNERANFGNVGTSAGTVTLGVPITAYGINFALANYVITNAGVGANTLTLAGTGGVINSNVAATINAQIAGNVGLTKTGSGALTLNAANTYSGTTTVTGGTLLGVTQASGSPFSSGPITLNNAILQLKAVTGSLTTTTNVGDLTIGAASTSMVGASQLTVDNTLAGGSATTTFAAGNLVRGGFGSALVVTPVGGALGTADIVTLSNGNSLLTNGILPPWVVTSSGTGPADYVTYGGSGVTVANYSSTDLTTSTNSSVVNQSSAPTVTGNVTAYALKNSATIDLTGHTLTLGNGSGQSGLILNGGSITNGNISFGSTEGVVYSGGTTILGSTGTTISSNGLTITALGATNMTINGNIQNGTSASQVTFTGVTSGTSLTLNGANGYTGGTILSVNTGSTGNVFIGNDSAFGTGKVTNIIVPGTSSDQIQAINGDHILANPFDLNGGMTFTGSNSLTFTGPITEINAVAGGARTLQNNITAAGKTITFGSAGSPSTITLGNPVSNGGDGVGKQLLFAANVGTASATSTFVINDVMQDPAAGGGTASGSVQYGSTGSTGGKGLYQINSQSTYSGTTTLNGNNQVTIQYATDTVGPSSSITKGPFGTGTLLFNNTSNDTMQPVGGGTRIISNPITLNFGYTFASATGDTTSAMFTGPITMLAAGRTLTNNLVGATLTLGDPANPTTFTLPTASGTTTAIAGTGNNTTVNDVIQEVPGSGNLSNVSISAGGTNVTVTMNAMNTYAGTTNFTGGGTIVPIVNSTNGAPGAIIAGPFGTGTLNFNNGTNQHMRPTGGNRTLANTVTMTTGFAMDNSTGDQSNLTFSGPINMTNNNGRTISNGFTGQTNVGGTLFIGDPNSPNVITLGDFTNPTGSAALGFGAWTGPIVVNDTIVDPLTVTKPFSVSVGPNTQTYPVLFNAANTYSGGFTVTGSSTSAVELGTSTVGDFGSLSSGPLGVGQITSTSTSATTQPLVPFNADRTLANGVTLNGNLAAANAGAQTFNLNLTGAVLLGTASRTITNNMVGTLTLGKATTADSTNGITLSQTAGQALTFNGSSTSNTVVNDAIVNGGGGIIPGNVTVAGSIVQFNNANTYGTTGSVGTTVSGGKLLVNNTSGSGTGAGDVTVQGGILGGNGTISGSVSVTSGAIAPGNSAGTLNVSGNVAFSGNGGFTVEIGGTTPGVGGYDQLVVGGAADLSGAGIGTTLTASLLSGFSLPTSVTDFTILTASGGVNLGGGFGFGTINFPDMSGRWTVNYNANSIVLHLAAAPAGVPGDYNSDGVVDAADYVVWRGHLGQAFALPNEVAGVTPGQVTQEDYAAWRARFGNTSGSGSSALGTAAVPEPGLLSLLVCAVGALLCSGPHGNRR